MRNERVKREIRVAKIESRKETVVRRQLNELPVAGKGTIEVLPKSQPSTLVSLDGEQKRVRVPRLTTNKPTVPVLSIDRKPLMPTTPSRARRWIKEWKATPFYNKGIFCIRLNFETGNQTQEIACGIDPGSKKEGFTIKSEAHTFLNIQADAVTWVKDAVERRRNASRARRFCKTPCRKNRRNRTKGCLPPSIKARWQWKLRLANWFCQIYPITCFVVEDIKAKSFKGKNGKWNKSFSPIEIGKNWFYYELDKLGEVELKQGWETAEMRVKAGLKKTGNKLNAKFSAHCVDSWVLANWFVGGHIKPDNENLLLITPLEFHRRQLHVFQPAKGGKRRLYGGTRSLGFKRGSIVTHPKYGKCYVGGTSNGRISLHSLETGVRLTQLAKPLACKFVTYNAWRMKN